MDISICLLGYLPFFPLNSFRFFYGSPRCYELYCTLYVLGILCSLYFRVSGYRVGTPCCKQNYDFHNKKANKFNRNIFVYCVCVFTSKFRFQRFDWVFQGSQLNKFRQKKMKWRRYRSLFFQQKVKYTFVGITVDGFLVLLEPRDSKITVTF